MPSETEIILTFIFKRSGKTEISFTEFYLSLSMDLNWFTPKQAKEFINMAIKDKMLSKKDEKIKPNFDIRTVSVPVGFYPSKKALKEEEKEGEIVIEEDVLKKIIKRISEKTKLDEKKIVEMIKTIEREKNITPEIAALIMGKEYNVSFEDFLDKTEKKIFD